MIVLNDHEEVGSSSRTGAAGPFLDHVIERLVEARGGTASDRIRALAGVASACRRTTPTPCTPTIPNGTSPAIARS